MANYKIERRTQTAGGVAIFEPPRRAGLGPLEQWGGAFSIPASASYGMKKVDGSVTGEATTKDLTSDQSDVTYLGIGNMTKLVSSVYRRSYQYADLMFTDGRQMTTGDYVLHIRYRYNFKPPVSGSAPSFYFQTHPAGPLPTLGSPIGSSISGIFVDIQTTMSIQMTFPTTGFGYCSSPSGKDCYLIAYDANPPANLSRITEPKLFQVYGIDSAGGITAGQFVRSGGVPPYFPRYPSDTTEWDRFELRQGPSHSNSTLLGTFLPYATERQTIAGPAWDSATAVPLGDVGGQSWVDYQMPVTIGELDRGTSASWVGSLYSDYFVAATDSTSTNELAPEVAQRFPILISRVSLEPYVPARKTARITGSRSSVRFS